MSRLFQSRVNFLVACVAVFWLGVSSQEQFEDLLGSNTKLWRSFQDEMRTLEEAAHKVNTMLSSGHHQSEAEQDQEVKAAETPLDVTVLASPDKLKDGLLTETDSNSEPKEVKLQDKKDNSDTAIGGDKVSFNPQSLNFGSLIHSLGFFRNLPEPWWKGKNVCVEKSEKVEDKKTGMKEQNEHVLIMGTGTFEHCKQTSGKYICTTVISTPESTKTVSTTYQCCEGFRRQAEGCVQGSTPSPSTTTAPHPEKSEQDAAPWTQYNTLNVGNTVEEDSFSSQSAEGYGQQPSWFRRYFQNGWSDCRKK